MAIGINIPDEEVGPFEHWLESLSEEELNELPLHRSKLDEEEDFDEDCDE